jgi:lysozyme family protein
MSDFNQAIGVILTHEGGWVNNKNDPGGATNYGISLRFVLSLADHSYFDLNHDGQVNGDDIRIMPKELAIKVYKEQFWDKFGYGNIVNQTVATKIFDMCVNMGSGQAHKIVQRALGIADDGVLGNGSRAAINAQDPNALVPKICDGQKAFYNNLVAQKPQYQEFLSGWLYRAAWPYHG